MYCKEKNDFQGKLLGLPLEKTKGADHTEAEIKLLLWRHLVQKEVRPEIGDKRNQDLAFGLGTRQWEGGDEALDLKKGFLPWSQFYVREKA